MRSRAARRSRHIAFLLTTFVGLVLACRESEPPAIRVGLLTVEEEPMGPVSGLPGRNGAHLAVDEINAAGGVMIEGVAHRLTLVERVHPGRPDAAATAARALVNLDSVDVIVGPQISSHAIAAATIAENSQVPLITPMASNPAVTSGRSMVFRLAFLDEFQGSILARFAFDSLRVRRVVALYDEANPYCRDIWRLFRSSFEARGGRILGEETFHTDAEADYRPQLRRLLALRPDAIVLPNYAVYDSVQVRQARELGFRGRFLGSDSWDPIAMTQIPAADGAVVVANWDARVSGPTAQAFIARYVARFGHAPRTTAAATYDAIRLIADAATRSGARGGPALATALGRTEAFDGAVTTYRFQGTGDPQRGGVILELRRGDAILRHLDVIAP
jgi:branched-chain amino acid transport system substrate-binding protein